MDLAYEGSVRAWAEEAVDAFGEIDIVYANAGAVRVSLAVGGGRSTVLHGAITQKESHT
ncbi:hypothetical protein ACIOEW_19695 [Streptomyces sp. NPDC087901]|uniref:hypothetical protein n=1 Tax=unclassified Streptomyces TaxID=2593676 RepID=UPI0034291640